MIDLDKYKGHTPGEWIRVNPNSRMWLIKGDIAQCTITAEVYAHNPEEQEANATLIADAPLLLSELKETRAELKKAVSIVQALCNTKCTTSLTLCAPEHCPAKALIAKHKGKRV